MLFRKRVHFPEDPSQAGCLPALPFPVRGVLFEGMWRGEEIKAVGAACPDFVISADEQGMGTSVRMQCSGQAFL